MCGTRSRLSPLGFPVEVYNQYHCAGNDDYEGAEWNNDVVEYERSLFHALTVISVYEANESSVSLWEEHHVQLVNNIDRGYAGNENGEGDRYDSGNTFWRDDMLYLRMNLTSVIQF